MVMIKLLIFTGVRNAELANIRLMDVDLQSRRVRIQQGKGSKDRYVPIPQSFRGELLQYLESQRQKKAIYHFCNTLKAKDKRKQYTSSSQID
jgi:integrase/recombinase XerD